ncbi:Mitogen-activated protein kinase kinase kinase ANP1 [Leucoagaricus sp. SymC.cos]|nr:Mitogen-activated protein kinase kinase kinase ANP1 [Leucoagaricus sp. SymC.cos]
MDGSSHAVEVKRSDPSTIQDKFLVHYVGWCVDLFKRPTNLTGNLYSLDGRSGWLQWFDREGQPQFDIVPDVSLYSPSELYPAPGLATGTNQPTFLFSSRNDMTVQRHFHWMAEHNVDGAFLYRWIGHCVDGKEHFGTFHDEVLDRVREAAERGGRVFAIDYSVLKFPGPVERIPDILQQDWKHLVHEKGLLDSPSYLRENGRPVIVLMGFGSDGAGHTPALVQSIAAMFRRITPGGIYIMAVVPAHWRTSDFDADPNPSFVDVWLSEFDGISPSISADNGERMKLDMEFIKSRLKSAQKTIDYIPSVAPGGSGLNATSGNRKWNEPKRNGGKFLWDQIYRASKVGARTLYGLSWDDYCNGTALMPVVPRRNLLPQSNEFKFMALDKENYNLSSDWYMRICGMAAEALHNRKKISKEFPLKVITYHGHGTPTPTPFRGILGIIRKPKTGSSVHSQVQSEKAGVASREPGQYLPNNFSDRGIVNQTQPPYVQKSKTLANGSEATILNMSRLLVAPTPDTPTENPATDRHFEDEQFETSLQLLLRVLSQRVSVGKRLAAINLDQTDAQHMANFLNKASKIVHADLKGANVLVSDIGRAMLTDFGISHIVSTRLETTTIASVGTPQWTAPELALGDGSSPTAESDIWSFGCVVYEVLTDNVPFHWFKTSHQILAAMMRTKITPLEPPVEDGSNLIDSQLRNIMERCFNYVERERPKSGDIIRFFEDLNIEDDRPLSVDDDTPVMAVPKVRVDVKIDHECVCKVLRIIRQTTLEHDDTSEGEE